MAGGVGGEALTSHTAPGGTANLPAEGHGEGAGGRVHVRERRRSRGSAPAVAGFIDQSDGADRRGGSPTSALHFSLSAAINHHELNIACR